MDRTHFLAARTAFDHRRGLQTTADEIDAFYHANGHGIFLRAYRLRRALRALAAGAARRVERKRDFAAAAFGR